MLLAEEIQARFTMPDRIEGWADMLVALADKNPALFVLILLMVIDVVTGVLASWICGTISSSASYKGMVRKVIMLALIAAARVMESVIPNAPLMLLGCLGFSCTELFSIVENAGKAGVPLPESLKLAFERFRDKDKEKDESKQIGPLVEVNAEHAYVDEKPEQTRKKQPSDVVIKVHDSGESQSPKE